MGKKEKEIKTFGELAEKVTSLNKEINENLFALLQFQEIHRFKRVEECRIKLQNLYETYGDKIKIAMRLVQELNEYFEFGISKSTCPTDIKFDMEKLEKGIMRIIEIRDELKKEIE